jgi:hypothetical protein
MQDVFLGMIDSWWEGYLLGKNQKMENPAGSELGFLVGFEIPFGFSL